VETIKEMYTLELLDGSSREDGDDSLLLVSSPLNEGSPIGIRKAVEDLRYELNCRGDSCYCGCTIPSLRSRIVDGVTVTWKTDSAEQRLYEKLSRVEKICALVTGYLSDVGDDENLELFECDGCISIIDGAEAFKDHLKFEEKRLTRKLVSKLLMIAWDSGKCSPPRTRVG
jgi:hypothetical protein